MTPEFNEKFWAPLAKEQFKLENTAAFIKAFETGILHLAGEVDDRFIYNEVLKEAFDKLIAGHAQAKDIIPEVNRKLQKILDDYWAKQRQ